MDPETRGPAPGSPAPALVVGEEGVVFSVGRRRSQEGGAEGRRPRFGRGTDAGQGRLRGNGGRGGWGARGEARRDEDAMAWKAVGGEGGGGGGAYPIRRRIGPLGAPISKSPKHKEGERRGRVRLTRSDGPGRGSTIGLSAGTASPPPCAASMAMGVRHGQGRPEKKWLCPGVRGGRSYHRGLPPASIASEVWGNAGEKMPPGMEREEE